MPVRESFQSTGARGLNFASPPMRLWQKAKKLGVWDPSDIDLTQDQIRLAQQVAGADNIAAIRNPMVMGRCSVEPCRQLTLSIWCSKAIARFSAASIGIAGTNTENSGPWRRDTSACWW